MNLAQTLFNNANQLQKEDRIEEARSLYLQALEVDPNYVPALKQLAALYIQSKQFLGRKFNWDLIE